jgi:hypothetical protein
MWAEYLSGYAGFPRGKQVGYRAWIRTMNNASKGRCVTVTPRGKTEDETLKAKPDLRKRQSC